MENKKIRFTKLFLFILAIIIILPLSLTLIWSFTVRWKFKDFFPRQFSLYGVEYFIKGGDYKLLIYSLLISTLVSIFTLVLAIPCGKALTSEFKGKKIIEILIFLPIIIPINSISIGIQVSFIKLGLAYRPVGVILMHIFPCIPYCVRIMKEVFTLIPNDYFEVSRNLGASKIKTFKHIILPLLSPGILAAFTMAFIISFSQYFITFLVGGGRVETFSTKMFPYIISGNRTVASLYASIFTLVALVFLIIINALIRQLYKNDLKDFHYL